MIRINLLPFRAARKKENIRQTVSIFLMSLILVLTGLGYYHFVLSREIEGLKAKIEFTKGEVAKYNKIAAEVEEIKKKLAILNKRLDVIIQLEANRDYAFRILDTLSGAIIEKRMWLTTFETIETKGKAAPAPKTPPPDQKGKEVKKEVPPPVVTARIEGIALDEKTISDFMEKLRSTQLFIDVDQQIKVEQKGFKQDKKADINLKGFTMRCGIVPPSPPKPDKDKEKKDADKADMDKADKSKADKKP